MANASLSLSERKPAERVGGVLHGDRAVVEVARDARPAGVGAGGDDAEARDQDDARPGGIDRERPASRRRGCARSTRGTSRRSRRRRGGTPRASSPRAVRRGVELDDERPVLRVDQVVGAGRADLADLGRALRRRERDRLGAAVDLEDHAVARRGRRAARAAPRRAAHSARSSETASTFGPPSPKRAVGRARDHLCRARDELDRRAVALLVRLAPGDEPVLLEQDGPRRPASPRAARRSGATCRSPAAGSRARRSRRRTPPRRAAARPARRSAR